MNEKLAKVVKAEGFCCMWAFLEANRTTHTSQLVKQAREAGITLTARAIRHQRREFRRKGSSIECKKLVTCLKERIRLQKTSP